jgi:hypothetical protein
MIFEAAKKYYEAGLSVIPVGSNKLPIGKWKQAMTEQIEPKASVWENAQLGLVCGYGGIEVIDIDCKYDFTGKLYSDFKKAINEIDKAILPKLTVQKTRGNGYHFIYKCSVIEGNRKLAMRPTTDEEKQQTYDLAIASKQTIEQAEKAKANDKERVLLETRGTGGYIMCAPSPGYEFIFGDILNVKEISTSEREIIFAVAATFNQVFKKQVDRLPIEKRDTKLTGCFDDYNNRGDVPELLQRNGWTYKGKSNGNEMYKRPGVTPTNWSAAWHPQKRIFYVFTSSTDFEKEKGYNASSVFCKLECNDDWKEAAKKLYEAGYGERIVHIKDEVNFETQDGILNFLSTADEISDYIFDFRDGKIEIGKDWGLSDLDEHLKFKRGNFYGFNGFPNVGKSTILYYLAALSTVTLNLRWVIYSSETNHRNLGRRLIEFRFGKPTKQMSDMEIAEGMNWLDEHFLIIREENYWTYLELITASEAALKYKRYDCLMIDPYNSLKNDSAQYKMFGGYEYKYVVASFFRHFCKKYNISIFLNLHPQTDVGRVKPDKEGKTIAPEMADSEGGGVWGNRIDDFATFHRHVKSKFEWMLSEIHVRKVKEQETGGKPTVHGMPIIISMHPNKCGFTDSQGVDPMQAALEKKKYESYEKAPF